jgi:hypothetical protein
MLAGTGMRRSLSHVSKPDGAVHAAARQFDQLYMVTLMSKLYRIEIDVVLEDRMRRKVIQAAREHYKNSDGAWTEEDGQMVRISAEEFVDDTRTAFLELTEAGFRTALPGIEPQAFRCGIENSIAPEYTQRASRHYRVRTVGP